MGAPIKVALIGGSGRTGALVAQVLPDFPEFKLQSALVSSSSKKLGQPVPGHPDVRFSADLKNGISESDVVIDFSTPASAMESVRYAAEFKRPMLVATTGLAARDLELIERAAHDIPILVASNTSVGVYVLSEVAAAAQRLLGPDFDVEILEMHHRMKKDAPSGTALTLARGLKGEIMSGRSTSKRARQNGEVGVESLRGGDVAGDHTIFFLGKGERLELTHRVSDRSVFARGALRLVRELFERPPGLHSVGALLSSQKR